MRKQMSIVLADFRYVSIACPQCGTRVVLDMLKRSAFAETHDMFAPNKCPGCQSGYDSAIRPNVDQLQKAYQGLVEIADRISFLGEPEES